MPRRAPRALEFVVSASCLRSSPPQHPKARRLGSSPAQELAAAYNCPYNKCVRYEWDTDKAEANLKAHGVSFADAVTVFEDDFALTREDPDAEGEQRFVTLGADATSRLLVVVYTYREPDVTRLISAWKANKTQRTQYESHLG